MLSVSSIVPLLRLLLLLALTECSGLTIKRSAIANRHKRTGVHAAPSSYSEGMELSIEEIAARYKVTAFGDNFGIENTDMNCVDVSVSALVSRAGGLGLDLAEMQRTKGKGGLVLIADIAKGSNAEKAGKFKVGDALLSVADARTPTESISLQGLNFDATVEALGSFPDDCKSLELTLMRLVKREKINIEVYGPDGTFVETFQLPAAYGVNLRRELLAREFKMYDENTYRFDSQYQTGDCGGDGTCATCAVAIAGDKVSVDKFRSIYLSFVRN